MLRAVVFTFLVLSLVGCSGKEAGSDARHKPSDRERDSLIARSKLPGATVVGRALSVADSASARNQRIESQMR